MAIIILSSHVACKIPKVIGEADIAVALAPSVLFNPIYFLCVCQEHLLSAQWVGCRVSEKIDRARSVKMLMSHLTTQTRKSESALGTLMKRRQPRKNCQLSNFFPGKGLVRLWKTLAIFHIYQAIFL